MQRIELKAGEAIQVIFPSGSDLNIEVCDDYVSVVDGLGRVLFTEEKDYGTWIVSHCRGIRLNANESTKIRLPSGTNILVHATKTEAFVNRIDDEGNMNQLYKESWA